MNEYTETTRGYGKFYYKDKEKTILHREDGPAIEYADGVKVWYLNGKRHREDGPAIEYANGDRAWYLNGKLHREDGPAIEYSSGRKIWYIGGIGIFAVDGDGNITNRME